MKDESIAPGDVTEMLVRWHAGDETALDALLPQVYDEIRRLADRFLRGGAGRHTLQAARLWLADALGAPTKPS